MAQKTNIYWNKKGKYQQLYDELKGKIPSKGKSEESHIDLLRNITNCYYDHYNNGNCNWGNKREQFSNIQYNSDVLASVAKSEGVKDIDLFLRNMRIPLDIDLKNDEFYCGKNDKVLADNWEKLADIVIKWTWDEDKK